VLVGTSRSKTKRTSGRPPGREMRFSASPLPGYARAAAAGRRLEINIGGLGSSARAIDALAGRRSREGGPQVSCRRTTSASSARAGTTSLPRGSRANGEL